MKKGMKYFFMIIIISLIMASIIIGINFYVIFKTKNKIISESDSINLENIDCILILGAGIRNEKPTNMLEDRLLTGISLYNKNVAPKIVMSGDHGKKDYDEVNIMKKFAIDKGVITNDIFMDHAGFSTYESLYRIKEIFEAEKIVIVTQKYHLYRSLYIADSLGIKAYGVASNPRLYTGQFMRDIREIIARDKDFFKCIIKPKPTYLGETIPVSGDGDITNDK